MNYSNIENKVEKLACIIINLVGMLGVYYRPEGVSDGTTIDIQWREAV